MKLFAESRGYPVPVIYNQYIYGFTGNTQGFTYDQYKAEIDAGNPVFIHLDGHTMLGVGYGGTDQVIVHDTWDYSDHTMTWGGSYGGMVHNGVTVIHLAGPSLGIDWQGSYGGLHWDSAYSVNQTSDGGYIVAGSSNSLTGDVTGNHGVYDCWVVKLTPTGALDWQRSLGGSDDDSCTSVDPTSDGGYIVAGTSRSNDGNVTGNHGVEDFWVIKLTPAGYIDWQKSFGGTFYDIAQSVMQTSDGGYIVAGHTQSQNGNVTGNHGYADFWILKLTPAGNLEWQRCLGGSGWDYAYSIEETSDGGYIVTGTTSSTDGNVTGKQGYHDYWIVKLTPAGYIEWQRCLGGSDEETARSVKQTPDGGYIVAGYTRSGDGNVTRNYGYNDYWVVKLTPAGMIDWQKNYGGSLEDRAYSVELTPDGGYIVAGMSLSNDHDVSGNHGYYDYWVVKLSQAGTIDWQMTLGGSSEDDAYSVGRTSDSGYIIAGASVSNNGDVSGNHGASDYWIVKLIPDSYTFPPSPIPTVKFSVNVSTGIAPLAVKFTDQSTGLSIGRWTWKFGDGTSFDTIVPSEKSPAHAYPAAGIYAPRLTVCNESGCNTTAPGRLISVNTHASPIIKFTTNTTTGFAPLGVKFTDLSSSSPTNWNWSFGDGTWFNTTVASQKSPAHVYTSASTYTAKLIACNAAGCNTTGPTKIITVTSLAVPTVKFVTNVSSGYSPLAVKFMDTSTGSPTKWNWSFGDGTWFNTSIASQKSPAHVYTTGGTYTAKLIACNAAGCNTTGPTKTITVTSLAIPTIKFVTNVSSGYAPLAVKFMDQSTGSPTKWNWSFGDGTWFNTTVASQKSPAHVYTGAGTYTAKLVACNAAGCNTTGPTKIITVNTLSTPIVKFVTNRTSGAAPLPVKFIDQSTGSPTEWRWGFGDGSWFNTTVISLKNPAHTYTVQGSYPSRLIACNAAGCNTTAPTRTITVS